MPIFGTIGGQEAKKKVAAQVFWFTAACAQKLEFRFTKVSRTGRAKTPKQREVPRARPIFYITFAFKIPKLRNMKHQKTRESGIREVKILSRAFGRFVGRRKKKVELSLTKEEDPSKHFRFSVGISKRLCPRNKRKPKYNIPQKE